MSLVCLDNRKAEVFSLLLEVFSPLMKVDNSILDQEVAEADYALSRGIEVDGKLVAVYLLAKHNEPFNQLSGCGVEGLALAVKKEFRGHGWGKELIRYAETLDFDYIWGQAAKGLGNLDQWLKTRKYLGEQDDSFYTYKVLTNKAAE